ncbi:hypothetical protein [Streptomyces parvus]|uniref:hypothetical protein n=1 Tax=Streptomyces parvus TaxID=66428 RepID=UPI0035E0DBA9
MPEQTGFPTVQGHCPACDSTSLFLGSGGYVTCARIDCPQPDAASIRLEKQSSVELNRLRADLEDQRKARQTAAGAADRFRDVLSEALGHDDENPGDDALIAELRAHFGKTGPEPTRWRDFLTGAEAIRDQINAAHRQEAP